MADGKIIAISISERKGQKKHNIESANLIVDHGMEGDAHAGNWHRQISLQVGDDVILEITQIGKECHQGCEIMKQVGSCIMPTQGIFGKVLKTGMIHVGDEVSIIK